MKIFPALVVLFCGAFAFAGPHEIKQSENQTTRQLQIAYNYCTLSYTMAFWDESEWGTEIDRLQTDGFNAALVMAGNPEVWRLTLGEFGWSEEAIDRFIPGEELQAWWNMANLYGTTTSTISRFHDSTISRFIVRRMRERGIDPILQAYTGMLPPDAAEYLKGSDWRILEQGDWSVFKRPPLLDPTCPGFKRFAAAWYRNLEKVYGIKPKFLAGDLFHEGGDTGGVNVAAAARAVQTAQQKAFPGAVWVIQMWQANPTRELLSGVDKRHTLIEALVKDMSRGSEDYTRRCQGVPWVWCEVMNFGGNHGLYGGLRKLAALENKSCGWGMLSEGLETNQIFYDLFRDVRRGRKIDFDAWLEEWVAKRYCNAPKALEAWRILTRPGGVYDPPAAQEGTVENVLCAFPSLKPASVTTWGPKTGLYYPASDTRRAAELMLQAAREQPALLGNRAFRCDLCDISRQALADRARELASQGSLASPAGRERFMEILALTENLLACVDEFRLDWQEARRHGHTAQYRRMITTWAPGECGQTTLTDYAHRNLAGLFKDYYAPRWQWFFDTLDGKITPAEFDRRIMELYRAFPDKQLAPTPKGDLLHAATAAVGIVNCEL